VSIKWLDSLEASRRERQTTDRLIRWPPTFFFEDSYLLAVSAACIWVGEGRRPRGREHGGAPSEPRHVDPCSCLRFRVRIRRLGSGRAEIAGSLAIVRPMFYNCHWRQVGLVLPGFTA